MDETEDFGYCNKVDIHALSPNDKIEPIVAIAEEHGFRGIVVQSGQLEKLSKVISSKTLLSICAIDFPYGGSSIDIRTYSILAAKEKGANEIEIVAPYHLLNNMDFRHIHDDIHSVLNTAEKAKIGVKYVLDQSSMFLPDNVRTRMCRILSSVKIGMVSTSLGFFDQNISHGDNILKMRNLKNKVGCQVKVYINTSDPATFALYPKAGADIVGTDWKNAPFIVHAYEDVVQRKG